MIGFLPSLYQNEQLFEGEDTCVPFSERERVITSFARDIELRHTRDDKRINFAAATVGTRKMSIATLRPTLDDTHCSKLE
jgi:hypothetical protein